MVKTKLIGCDSKFLFWHFVVVTSVSFTVTDTLLFAVRHIIELFYSILFNRIEYNIE